MSRGQSPRFARETDKHTFSQLIKRSNLRCSAQRNPKYNLKNKKYLQFHCKWNCRYLVFRGGFCESKVSKGKPSLAELPLFCEQSPGLFTKFTLFGAHCVLVLNSFTREFFGSGLSAERKPEFYAKPVRRKKKNQERTAYWCEAGRVCKKEAR